jgi:hypothetical protein
MTTIENLRLCPSSGGSVSVVKSDLSPDGRHLVVISRGADSSLRILTFVREEPSAADAYWAEIGTPSRTDSLSSAQILAEEAMRRVYASQ